MKNLIILFISISALASQCHRNGDVLPKQTPELGTLRNFSGISGCGWIIQLDFADQNGVDKLEPTNLKMFHISLVDGQKVEVKYSFKGGQSTCMVGKIVDIQEINLQ